MKIKQWLGAGLLSIVVVILANLVFPVYADMWFRLIIISLLQQLTYWGIIGLYADET